MYTMHWQWIRRAACDVTSPAGLTLCHLCGPGLHTPPEPAPPEVPSRGPSSHQAVRSLQRLQASYPSDGDVNLPSPSGQQPGVGALVPCRHPRRALVPVQTSARCSGPCADIRAVLWYLCRHPRGVLVPVQTSARCSGPCRTLGAVFWSQIDESSSTHQGLLSLFSDSDGIILLFELRLYLLTSSIFF